MIDTDFTYAMITGACQGVMIRTLVSLNNPLEYRTDLFNAKRDKGYYDFLHIRVEDQPKAKPSLPLPQCERYPLETVTDLQKTVFERLIRADTNRAAALLWESDIQMIAVGDPIGAPHRIIPATDINLLMEYQRLSCILQAYLDRFPNKAEVFTQMIYRFNKYIEHTQKYLTETICSIQTLFDPSFQQYFVHDS